MSTDMLTILEMTVDGAGLIVCLVAVVMILRSRRIHRRRMAERPMMGGGFSRLMDTRRIGQAAESAFSALAAAVDAQRQQFMAALEDPALQSAPAAGAVDRRVADGAGSQSAGLPAPATLCLARKIQQRQQDRRQG